MTKPGIARFWITTSAILMAANAACLVLDLEQKMYLWTIIPALALLVSLIVHQFWVKELTVRSGSRPSSSPPGPDSKPSDSSSATVTWIRTGSNGT